TVQMPAGVPVATMAVGKPGAQNAGHLAAQILALGDPVLRKKVGEHRRRMAEEVAASAEEGR
ncbi:MAG: AIR carboxylase family protein, partial [Thermodesulfobacteriota bacterium]|nr:AIR carboxylase family protein [Thermodesulfobacteriota bacterium]